MDLLQVLGLHRSNLCFPWAATSKCVGTMLLEVGGPLFTPRTSFLFRLFVGDGDIKEIPHQN